MSIKRLHLLAGPNGAGKSTFVDRVLHPMTGLPFVNADAIAVERWPGAQSEHAYEASRVASVMRDQLMSEGRSFNTETVFSHPSKVALVQNAATAGYRVYIHVIMVPVDVTVGRVGERVKRGGHSVPEEKIRQRYDRLWRLIVRARQSATRTDFYDKSDDVSPYRHIATYHRGVLSGHAQWPQWTPEELL